MKGKISLMWRVAVALVLVLSLSLVMATPVSAAFANNATAAAVTDITPATAGVGEDDVGILDVAVTEGAAAADLITSIAVTSACTSDADVEFVKLYLDAGGGTFDPAANILLGTSTGFVASTATFTAGGVDGAGTGSLKDGVGVANDGIDIGASATETFYVVFDVSALATNGNQLDAQILALGITMTTAGDGEAAALDPPGVSNIVAEGTGQLDATNPGALTVYPGEAVIVLGFEIVDSGAADALDILLERVTFTKTGTSVDADVQSIELWEDVDDDGAITVADTQLGATSVLATGTVIFGTDTVTMSTIADGTTKDYLVRVTPAAHAVDANIIVIGIANLADYDVNAAGSTMTAGVIAGSNMTIDSDMDITDVAIVGATPPLPGATNVAVQQLRFTEPGIASAVNIQTVQVSNVGSDTYVDKVALWEDVDDDGAFDPTGTDAAGKLGEGTFTSGVITFGTLGVTLFDIPAGATTQNVFVVYDISSLSPDGAQFKSRIVNPSLDVTFNLGSDLATAPVTSTNPQTVTTAIKIGNATNNPGGGTIGAGVTNFAVQGLDVTDCGTGTDIDIVSIDRDTATPATAVFGVDVTKVSLWKDDGDGIFDANTDLLLGSDTTPTNAATTIGVADVVLTSLVASEVATLWITVDTSATATAGLIVGTEIGDAIADISVTSTSQGTELDAVNTLRGGGTYAIGRAIIILASGNPGADNKPGAGQSNVLIQGFTVKDSGNAAGTDIDVVSIDETGSADFGIVATSDVTKVSLWRDDGDGTFDVNSDTLLGSDLTPGVISTIGTQDVLLTNVANAATVQFWVTVDIQANATATTPTDGQKINTIIGNAVGDISVTSTSQGQGLAATPSLAGFAQTITRRITVADPVGGANPGVDNKPGVGHSNVLIKEFTVKDSGNDAGSDIDVVSIDKVGGSTATYGSASTTDVSKVSLWRDDGDGAFSAASDTLLGEDLTPATTSTIGTPNVVLTNIADGATVTFWLTVDVRGTATNGRTINLSVDDAAPDINMTATSQGLQLAGAGGLTNQLQTITRNILPLAAGVDNPVGGLSIGVGRTDVLVQAIAVTDSGNIAGTDIDLVYIDDAGTAVFGTDVTKVSLWLDAGTAGFQGTGVDTLLGEDTTPGVTSVIGTSEVVLVNVPDDQAITLFITVDIPSTATDGRLIQTEVGDAPTDISVTSTSQGIQLAGPGAVTSNAQTIDYNVLLANPVTVVPALATAGKGATNVLVQELTVQDSGNGGGTQIDTVSIDRNAGVSVNFATDLTKISLWLDAGVAGWQGAGVDTLLGENTSPANEGTVIGTADTVLVDLARGQTRTLFVTVDTGTGVATGTTIETLIGDEANDVSVTSTSVGQGSAITGVTSDGSVTIADTLAIAAGPSDPAAQSLVGGQTDVLVQAFRLTGATVSGGTDIDTMTIEETGTADWAGDTGVVTNVDVSKLSLWRDEGAAGFQGTGVDTLLGSSTSPLSIGTTFGTVGTVLTHLDSGQAVQFLVTIDTAENADDDETVQTTIGNEQADITVTATSAGQDLGGAFATAATNAHTIHRLTSAATLSAIYTQGSTVVVRVDASLGTVFAGTVTVGTDEPAGTVLALDDGAGYDGTAGDGIFYAQFLTQSAGEHSGPVYLNGIAKATIAYTTTPTVILESISAEPESVSLAVDETQQLAITATYNDQSTEDVTADSTYVSDDETVATVSDAGLITAVAEGSATITVSYTEFGVTKTDTVSVTVSVWDPMIYDADEDGVMEIDEVLNAISDYFAEEITITQVLEVITLYF